MSPSRALTHLPDPMRKTLGRAALDARGIRVRADRKRNAPPQPRRLNIGGGNWYQRGWHNVDLYAHRDFVDFAMDFRDGAELPVSDSSVDLAFSSHVVEHISDSEVSNIVDELARVLAPGATLRIATPDPAKAFAAYERGDSIFFSEGGVTCVGSSIEQRLVNYFASYRDGQGYSGGPVVDPLDVQKRVDDQSAFPRWCVAQIPTDAPYRGHVNSWSSQRLCDLIRSAGFDEVWESGYRQSIIPELRAESFDNRPTVSLFVEARR